MLENPSVRDAVGLGLKRDLDMTISAYPLRSLSLLMPNQPKPLLSVLRVLLCGHQKAGRCCLEDGESEADSFILARN